MCIQCTLNVHAMHLTSRFALCEMYIKSTFKVHSTYVQVRALADVAIISENFLYEKKPAKCFPPKFFIQ